MSLRRHHCARNEMRLIVTLFAYSACLVSTACVERALARMRRSGTPDKSASKRTHPFRRAIPVDRRAHKIAVRRLAIGIAIDAEVGRTRYDEAGGAHAIRQRERGLNVIEVITSADRQLVRPPGLQPRVASRQ